MQLTPQHLVFALLLIAPGFIATILAISWGAIEKEISNGRILAVSLVSSLLIDSTFIWIIQTFFDRTVTEPENIDSLFFQPRFQAGYVFLLVGLSVGLGFVYSIGLIVDAHGRSRQFLWNKFRRHDHRSRDPWQPWEGTLRDANLVKVYAKNGEVFSGKVYEYSRARKPRQLRLYEPEYWDKDAGKFKSGGETYMLFLEDDIQRVYVLLSDEEVREMSGEGSEG